MQPEPAPSNSIHSQASKIQSGIYDPVQPPSSNSIHALAAKIQSGLGDIGGGMSVPEMQGQLVDLKKRPAGKAPNQPATKKAKAHKPAKVAEPAKGAKPKAKASEAAQPAKAAQVSKDILPWPGKGEEGRPHLL